jgi:anti-repressor protein
MISDLIATPALGKMMQLVKLNETTMNGTSVQTVNARELHTFLGVGKVFGAWIADRIGQYGFTDGVDYVTEVNSEIGKNPMGGRPAKEYHISLDMAKELSMVERNEKGKQARQYFIAMERQAKTATSNPMELLTDPAKMRGLLLNYVEQVIELKDKIEVMRPAVEVHTRLVDAEGSVTITAAAKTLQVRPKDLSEWLTKNRWIYKRHGSVNHLGFQDKCNAGYLTQKVTPITRPDGTEKITEQVRITPKGLAKLATVFANM